MAALPLGERIVSLLEEPESERPSSPVPVPVPWLAEELTMTDSVEVARCRE
ncbi:hypothetical protein PHLCEN_2v1033 [Hermanssonia centrifuga]|uniref:Uncharacterized protein n=1 Tax=Hermanssonia centrifuga TaxID=98765 RepID=A0A2R6S4E0_9APHY|nr:hypothetical protein PHLCEN_2v1033 [Hermanssonia centrifuga]